MSTAIDAFSRRRSDPARRGASNLSEYTRQLNSDYDAFRDEGGHVGPTQYGGTPFDPSPGPAPVASLRRIASNNRYDDDDTTNYQMGRLALERQRGDHDDTMNARMRANDPGIQLYDQQRARDRAAADAQAGDTIDTDSFTRREPLERMKRFNAVQTAREMAPYNPAVIQSQAKLAGITDTNDTRETVAQTAAGARTGGTAISSLSRLAGTQTFGDAGAEARVNSAIGAVRPLVPGQAAARLGLKPLPAEWDFERLVSEKHGGDRAAAEAWLNQHGYTGAR